METSDQKQNNGITIQIPPYIEYKMEAISSLARAIDNLSLALNSINVECLINSCNIQNCEQGINIGFSPDSMEIKNNFISQDTSLQ